MFRHAKASFLVGMLLTTLAAGSAFAAPPKVGDSAKDFALKSPSGEEIRLSTLRAEGPVILVVLRGWPGYQCPLCTRQVAELVGNAKRFDESKSQLVLVYPGPADGLKAHAEEFAKAKNLPENFHFVTDPDYTFTKAYDLRWDAPNETAYPSTFVIDTEGKIRYAKISRGHGDRAKVADVLKALSAKTE